MDPNYAKKPIVKTKGTGRPVSAPNPYRAVGEAETQEDDQEQMDNSVTPGYQGAKNIMARIIMRKQALWDMPNKIPGMADPSQGVQSPWMGAGENQTSDKGQTNRRQWEESLPQRSKNNKKMTREEDDDKVSVRENDPLDPTTYNYSEGT